MGSVNPVAAPTPSRTVVISTVASTATTNDTIANEEGLTMNQLALVNSGSVTSLVGRSSKGSGAIAPFDYIQELESKHLAAVFDQVGGDPRQLHSLEKAWAIAKVNLAKAFAKAENELIEILRQAPSGTISSPEATAQEVLWSACSADLEKALLFKAQEMSAAGRTQGFEGLLKGTGRSARAVEVLNDEVEHRVEMAKILAHGMVDVAKMKASVPPAKSTGYEPCWGEVTGVKPPLGAFITLSSGETGLLHVREMSPLNGGRRVDDATALVNVGQTLHVRVTGKRSDGKLDFALASEV